MIREEDTIGKDRTDAQSGVGPVLSHGQESADPFDAGSSDSAGTGLEILDPRIVDWVRSLGWDELRPIQRDALGPILSGTTDVILSAATASGKTEAAFLPAISRILEDAWDGTPLLYLSPLKALINDQYRRLAPLCARLNLPLIPWHGGPASPGQAELSALCPRHPAHDPGVPGRLSPAPPLLLLQGLPLPFSCHHRRISLLCRG